MSDPDFLLMYLIVSAVMLVFITFIGALFLRAGVSLYNKMVGGPNSPTAAPEPPLGKAMGITFVTALVNKVVEFVVGLAIIGNSTGYPAVKGSATAQLVAFPLSILVMASMLSALLPTTFGRGLLVALCQLLIAIIIGVGIGIVILVIAVLLPQ